MPSERVQRQIDRLFDKAEQAIARFDWDTVRNTALAAPALNKTNEDAQAYLAAANERLQQPSSPSGQPDPAPSALATARSPSSPSAEAAPSAGTSPPDPGALYRLAHLDFAIGEFRAMKMTPSLERALARKGMMGA